MNIKLLLLTVFGIMGIMSLFVYIPFSDTVNLTDEGVFVEGTFEVDGDWEDFGVLSGDMETDSNIIYAPADQEGVWTSNLIEGERFDVISFETLSDTRDGNIFYTINLWDSTAEGEPDEVIEGEVDEVEYFEEYEGLQTYDVFEVELEIVEEGGNSNKRPHVSMLRVDYVENLDRDGLGFDNSSFQVFTLFVLIGSLLLAMVNSIV